MTRSTLLRIAREGALTLGAILGALCLIVTLVLPLLNMRVLVFTSGSMSPTISVGAAALARTVPADELSVGDIVSVEDAEGNRITHRITELRPTSEGTALELTGDANLSPDAEEYVVEEADLVIAHLDGAGYVVDALSSPWASFAAGGAAVALLALAFGRRRDDERDDERGGDGRGDDNRGAPSGTDRMRAVPQVSPASPARVASRVADRHTVPADPPRTRRAHEPDPVAATIAADPPRTRRAARAAMTAAGALCLALAVGVATVGVPSSVVPTEASFTDTAAIAADASTTTVAAPTPANVPCTNGAILSGSIYLGAVAPAGAPLGYEFLIEVREVGSDEVLFSATTTNETYTLSRGSLPGSSSFEASYRGTLAGTSWVSPTGFSTPFTTGLLGWDINCA